MWTHYVSLIGPRTLSCVALALALGFADQPTILRDSEATGLLPKLARGGLTSVVSGGSSKIVGPAPSVSPLGFEPNRCQIDGPVRFFAQARDYTAFLTSDGAVLKLALGRGGDLQGDRVGAMPEYRARHTTPTLVTIRLVGADPSSRPIGTARLPGMSNYLLGREPQAWCVDVPRYSKVTYKGVYPGVDLIYHGDYQDLAFDFVVSPGTDPSVVQVDYEGAQDVRVDSQGGLVVRAGGAVFYQPPPNVVVDGQDVHRRVPAKFVLRGGNRVGFAVLTTGEGRPPGVKLTSHIAYSTYLGGHGFDVANDVATDGSGSIYVVGTTSSLDFPGAAKRPTSLDVFVTKFNQKGELVYTTTLGGQGRDEGNGIAVDSRGRVYVTGSTCSVDFPTTPQSVHPGSLGGPCQDMWTIPVYTDAFAARLSAAGSKLEYSTYLGGGGSERGYDIAAGDDYTAEVVGWTASLDMDRPHAAQGHHGGGTFDAFVVKLNPEGSHITYATYLGGESLDWADGVALDRQGNVYVTGGTGSSAFPTTPTAFQTSLHGGTDAFVTKLDPSGILVYSTYIGGTGGFQDANAVAVDASQSAYVTGATGSGDFPRTKGVVGMTFGGGEDAFVVKLTPDGSRLAYATYLGGWGYDRGKAIAVDGGGQAYVTGYTDSESGFPTSPNAIASNSGAQDAFVTVLDEKATGLVYSTYLGGTKYDHGNGIALSSYGVLYVVGETMSSDFPVKHPFQAVYRGETDAFVIRIDR